MRSWSEEFEHTWLADGHVTNELDVWVKGRLAGHRRLPRSKHPDVAPLGVSVLVLDVRLFGEDQRWFWVTAACCLLGELLFAAESGGVFLSGASRWGFRIEQALKPLVILRNSAFHPAYQNEDARAGPPHIVRLVEWLSENGEADLSARLNESWAFLANRPFASLALRNLNAAGRLLAQSLRVA